MPKKQVAGTSALKDYGDIFRSSVSPVDGERILHIPLSELYPPDYHPFQVNDDLAMTRLAENVRHYGVREPGIARPRPEGGYELLCGNRRKRACEIMGIDTMPVIVRELDNDSAVLVMVDSNLEQREKILPSERAWAYKMMMEALNHNGIKGEVYTYEIVAERTGMKKSQLFRFIRLTELIFILLDKVDSGQLSFTAAVELSYLTLKEQTAVAEAMDTHAVKPSLSQAIRLKKLKKDGKLTPEMIDVVLSEEKKAPKNALSGNAWYRSFFPPDYSPKQMDAVIVELLTGWKANSS